MGNLIQENTRWPSVCFMKEEVVVNDPKKPDRFDFCARYESVGLKEKKE